MTTTTIDADTVRDMPVHGLAGIVRSDWTRPYFAAVPYIDAMSALDTVDDMYGMDPGRMIVAYFLANAGTWRGPVARVVKAELKRRTR